MKKGQKESFFIFVKIIFTLKSHLVFIKQRFYWKRYQIYQNYP